MTDALLGLLALCAVGVLVWGLSQWWEMREGDKREFAGLRMLQKQQELSRAYGMPPPHARREIDQTVARIESELTWRREWGL